MKQSGKRPGIRVKSKRHGHLYNLGLKTDLSNFQLPGDYIDDDSEILPLLTKALNGDLVGLLKILNSREKDRLYTFLNNQKKTK